MTNADDIAMHIKMGPEYVPLPEETWRKQVATTLFMARRELARPLWQETPTEEFPSISVAVRKLGAEAGAANAVAEWHYFSGDVGGKPYPCKLIRGQAQLHAARQREWTESTTTVRDNREMLAAYARLFDPALPSPEEMQASERYLSRSFRLRALALACAQYAAIAQARTDHSNPNLRQFLSGQAALASLYRLLGTAEAFEVALTERALAGNDAREVSLEKRRVVARLAINAALDQGSDKSAPQLAEDLVSPSIKLSQRTLAALINEERRFRARVHGKAHR